MSSNRLPFVDTKAVRPSFQIRLFWYTLESMRAYFKVIERFEIIRKRLTQFFF